MSGVRRFVLDTNVFIEANRRYYPFDICPGFWRALILQHEEKNLRSIDRVENEIQEGKDDLSSRRILQKNRGPGRHQSVPEDGPVGIQSASIQR